jgi:hypothetical protein
MWVEFKEIFSNGDIIVAITRRANGLNEEWWLKGTKKKISQRM